MPNHNQPRPTYAAPLRESDLAAWCEDAAKPPRPICSLCDDNICIYRLTPPKPGCQFVERLAWAVHRSER